MIVRNALRRRCFLNIEVCQRFVANARGGRLVAVRESAKPMCLDARGWMFKARFQRICETGSLPTFAAVRYHPHSEMGK